MVFFLLYAAALVISLTVAHKRPVPAVRALTGITRRNKPCRNGEKGRSFVVLIVAEYSTGWVIRALKHALLSVILSAGLLKYGASRDTNVNIPIMASARYAAA